MRCKDNKHFPFRQIITPIIYSHPIFFNYLLRFFSQKTDNLATAPQRIVLMTFGEVLFIKAELAQVGIISADAKTLYEQAVTAAVEQWGVSGPFGKFRHPISSIRWNSPSHHVAVHR